MTNIDAFLTGSTGLVGRWLLAELTARGRKVGALLRGSAARAEGLRAWIDAHGGRSEAITFFEGDLASEGLGLTPFDVARLSRVRDVLHIGGVMRFDMTRQEAFATNVKGTEAVLSLATRSALLERVVVIGGFRLGHGAPGERRGAYEESKIVAEKVAIDAAAREGFALSRVQPGGVIGDSRTGETTQLFGFAELVRDLWLGRVPALPGGARHWMPLVSVDYLARFVAGLCEIDPSLADGEHVVLDDLTPNLDELVERLTRHMGVTTVRRRAPKGALQAFLRAGGSRLVGTSAESLDFLHDDRYDLTRARQAARRMGLADVDVVAAALKTVDFLLSTRFGLRPASSVGARRAGRMARVAGQPTFVAGARDAAFVMLHGLPLDADAWGGLARGLAGAADALCPDLPGLGRSAGEGSAPLDFMRSLTRDTDRPVVVGHSLGTRYAVEYAAHHPDRVEALVLIAPYFALKPPPAPLRSPAVAAMAISLAPPAKILPPSGLDDEERAAASMTLKRPGARARLGRALGVAHQDRAAVAAMLARACAGGVPVLVVVGERDPLVSELPADVQIRTVEGSGHFPQLDAPATVAEHVRGFLASVTRAPAPSAAARLACG